MSAQPVLARVTLGERRFSQIVTNLRKAADGVGILSGLDARQFSSRLVKEADSVSPQKPSGRIAAEFAANGINKVAGNWRGKVIAHLFRGSPTVTIAVTHALLELRGNNQKRGEYVFDAVDKGSPAVDWIQINRASPGKGFSLIPERISPNGKPAPNTPWFRIKDGTHMSREGTEGYHMTETVSIYIRKILLPEIRAKVTAAARKQID